MINRVEDLVIIENVENNHSLKNLTLDLLTLDSVVG